MSSARPGSTEVGARIRKRRQALGWEQKDLAERTGVHVNSVQKWESGTHYPGRKLGKLEQVLGISLDEPGTESVIPPDLLAQIRRDIAPEDQGRVIEAIRRELGGTTAPREEAGSSSPDHRRRAG